MSLVDFCTAIENVNKVTGIFSNVLLLHLISKYSRPSLGTYKYLLIVFACSDVMLTTVHASINHQVVSVGTTFASVAYTFAESRCLTAIYCSSFTFAFSMNVFNFLYRYWAVKHPSLVRYFTNKYFISLLATIAASMFVVWYLICVFGSTGGMDEIGTIIAREEYYRRFGRNLTDGFQILDHWVKEVSRFLSTKPVVQRDGQFMVRQFCVLLACDIMIFSCISFACLFALLCFHHIQKAEKLSTQSKMLQTKLLITLCAQTAVPIIFVFLPYFFAITCPFIAVDIHAFNVGCTAIISFFPACDAVVIITLTTDYRNGLKSIILRRKTTVNHMENTTMVSKISETMN